MDGRTQLPVNEYLQEKFGADYIDTITEPGPVAILSDKQGLDLTNSIIARLEISVKKHGSVGIAIVAHHDCAGNPVDEQHQKAQLEKAVKFILDSYCDIPVIGLWLDSDFTVFEII